MEVDEKTLKKIIHTTFKLTDLVSNVDCVDSYLLHKSLQL